MSAEKRVEISELRRAANAHDGFGNLVKEYQAHDGKVSTSKTSPSPFVEYKYTFTAAKQNRLASITYPLGSPASPKVVSFNYASGLDSNISRLTSISDNTGTLESYSYMGLGTVVARSNPASGLSYVKPSLETKLGDAGDIITGLDRFGRVVDHRWSNDIGRTTDRFQYGYDRNDNRLYRNVVMDASDSTAALSSSYGELYHANGAASNDAYDKFNQLQAFSRGTLSASISGGRLDRVSASLRGEVWSADPLGNSRAIATSTRVNGSTMFLPIVRDYNAQNGLTKIASTTLSYDNNGNQLKDDHGFTLVFDAWDRLVEVKDAGNTVVARYRYDALGRRITETYTVNGQSVTTDLYHSKDWQVLEERQAGKTTNQYVWSPVYVNALILRDEKNANGTTARRLFVQQDANWNVTALVNTAGQVVERYAYDPYGKVLVLKPDWTPTANNYYPFLWNKAASQFGWRYLFQGGRIDDVTGLYNFQRRDYSPTQQRWIEEDPIGIRGGDNNFYRFAGNNPANHTDPTGEIVPLIVVAGYIAYTALAVTATATVVTVGAAVYTEYKADQIAEELRKPLAMQNEARIRELTADMEFGVAVTKYAGYTGLAAGTIGISVASLPLIAAATPYVASGAGAAYTWTTTTGAAYVTTGGAAAYNYGTRAINVTASYVQRGAAAVSSAASRVWEGARSLVTRAGNVPANIADKFRRTPMNLKEQLTLKEAQAGAGHKIINNLNDPRFKGMEKWSHIHKNFDGSQIEVHYVRDPKTGALMDFKFK